MNFRTEIEIPRTQPLHIDHSQRIVMLGSCFTDNIGALLERDGFLTVHNPMGALYNPLSIEQAISLALYPSENQPIFTQYTDTWHCLNFATKYSLANLEALTTMVNTDLDSLGRELTQADTVIITLGTAFIYRLPDKRVVGNCHKLHPDTFTRTMLSVDEIRLALQSIIKMLGGKRIIFTVSPIRHTADTLHGNQLSKAALQLAVDSVIDNNRVHYFPAYEIMIDDLRDYRFYAADMKHPSDTAVEYIYETFAAYYFTPATLEKCRTARKDYKRAMHRPINPNQ